MQEFNVIVGLITLHPKQNLVEFVLQLHIVVGLRVQEKQNSINHNLHGGFIEGLSVYNQKQSNYHLNAHVEHVVLVQNFLFLLNLVLNVLEGVLQNYLQGRVVIQNPQ